MAIGFDTQRTGRGWREPPVGEVRRSRPLLVNYCHIDSADLQMTCFSQRLAQWDVLILFPQQVRDFKISFDEIRRLNPRVKILAWVPLQGASDPLLHAKVPPVGEGDWFSRHADGGLCIAPWGSSLMNPYAQNFSWPKAILDYVASSVMPEGYDGVMLDCLWEEACCEDGGSGVDVNGDGKRTSEDQAAWITAMEYLLKNLRERHPPSIITGNAGIPWSVQSSYYRFSNGCMHENALGNGINSGKWIALWNGINQAAARVKGGRREFLHFVMVDLQHNRTVQQAANATSLTNDDLRRFRLGLTTAMLRDNVYFGFSRGSCLHGQLWWFDEYDADVGIPIDDVEQDVWGAGTWRRQFANGWVVVNMSDKPITVWMPWDATDASTKICGRGFVVPPQDGRILMQSKRGVILAD
ncbi:MAG: putative glycoside hydrolase family 15 protein [Phycisphaerales bacterium]|nr:putative glycoside hydrolase family 15 protein [Phycisphaerales bacterium]